MSNKITTTSKKMASLGLVQTERGDYDYIDSAEKSKHKTISCKTDSLKTVEGNYKILVCEKK